MDPPGGEEGSHGESREGCDRVQDRIQIRAMGCAEFSLLLLLWDPGDRSRRTRREAFVGQGWHPGGSGRNADCLDHRQFAFQTEGADTFQRARKHQKARTDWHWHQDYWDSPVPAGGAAWVSGWLRHLSPFGRRHSWH